MDAARRNDGGAPRVCYASPTNHPHVMVKHGTETKTRVTKVALEQAAEHLGVFHEKAVSITINRLYENLTARRPRGGQRWPTRCPVVTMKASTGRPEGILWAYSSSPVGDHGASPTRPPTNSTASWTAGRRPPAGPRPGLPPTTRATAGPCRGLRRAGFGPWILWTGYEAWLFTISCR